MRSTSISLSSRVVGAVLALVLTLVLPQTASAGTTGEIIGTVVSADGGAPVAGVKVTAASPSGTRMAVTNDRGFFALQQLVPDTYALSFQLEGFEPLAIAGVVVQQDLVTTSDQSLHKTFKTIASVQTRSAGSLIKPYTGTDVYNVSGAQLNATTGGDNLHRTVYEYLATVPGITPIGGGFPAEPSIRGGYDVDNGYELDGIPITERVTGFFTTNLTDLGISNVEVYTGGLGASNAGNGLGVINSVIKSGSRPGFASLSLGFTGPDFNHYSRAELGGASPNNRYSWYFAYDSANSQTDYWSGSTNAVFPITNIGVGSGNPGYIYTRDFIANLHYRPDDKNDIQFFYQNSLFDGAQSYGLTYAGTTAFGLAPCPGAVSAPTRSNATGGIAPNGGACPLGLYLTAMPNGTGNLIGHYSGIGKIQWNHIINDHSSMSVRLAENFNQYIFDQKYSDPNTPQNNDPGGGTAIDSGCPQYPYAIGAPLPSSSGDATGSECTFDLGDYYQSRRAHQYYASLDYTSTPNENVTLKAGVGQEFDYSIRDVRYLNLFDYPGAVRRSCYGESFAYPCHNALTDTPTHVPYFYASGAFNLGRWTLEPGLRASGIYYGTGPQFGGAKSAIFFSPSLLGTYRLDPRNAFRFSYATSAQFLGTEFVYRLNSPTYNPATVGDAGIQPQINRVADFMWEHEFDPNTSLRFGPYYRSGSNYLASFTPVIGYKPGTTIPVYGDPELQNGLKIRSLGFELGFSHLDRHDTGASYWISSSYNNYWTQTSGVAGGQTSFINFPLPDQFLQQNIYVRGYQTPLLTATLTADVHSHGWHLLPVVYYAYDTFYNTGGCIPENSTGDGLIAYDQYSAPDDCTNITDVTPVLAPESIGAGYWYVNATLEKEIGKASIVGVRVSNLSNNQHGSVPCYNGDPSAPPVGTHTGCGGIDGPGSGYTAPVGYVYQPLTQDPRRIELFLNVKF